MARRDRSPRARSWAFKRVKTVEDVRKVLLEQRLYGSYYVTDRTRSGGRTPEVKTQKGIHICPDIYVGHIYRYWISPQYHLSSDS